MKILALHGLGSSALMLKEQLAPFIRDLGPSYHFTFLDGDIPCGRGPGVPNWASGPFYSYATGFTTLEMREALGRLNAFIEENGPFDGVFGFSLGASLAMAYMLVQQQRRQATPFCFAVLFSPIFIASPDECYCEELVQRLLDNDHTAFQVAFPHGDFMPLLEQAAERTLAGYLQVVLLMQLMGVGEILPNTNVDFLGAGRPEGFPRLMHPLLLQDRVRIPTVHVTGQKDTESMAEQSRVAQALCTPSFVWAHKHDGGHDVPFKRSDVQAIVSSIQAAAEEGEYMNVL